MSDQESKTRTITLTGRAPVRIREDEWPVIASGSYKDWDNQYEFQANREWKASIRVRQHPDGRKHVAHVSSPLFSSSVDDPCHRRMQAV